MAIRALLAEATAGQADNLASLLSPRLQQSIDYAQKLADGISDGILAARHLVLAFLDPDGTAPAPPVGLSIESEGFPPAEFIEELKNYLRTNARVQDVDQRGAWDPILRRMSRVLLTLRQKWGSRMWLRRILFGSN